MATRMKIGEFLVKRDLISEKQLEGALIHQKRIGGRIGPILVGMKHISQTQLIKALSEYFRVPPIDISSQQIDPKILELISEELAKKIGALPVQIDNDAAGKRVLYVVMKQPDDLASIDQLTFATNFKIQPMVTADKPLDDAIEYFYSGGGSSFASYDGRDTVLSFEETSPETFDHLYSPQSVQSPEITAVGDTLDERSRSSSWDAMDIQFDPNVDAKIYLKFLIKLLVKKGIIKEEDFAELVRG